MYIEQEVYASYPRGGNIYTGVEAAPKSAPLTGLGNVPLNMLRNAVGSCVPCGTAGLGAIPNTNRDGGQACRDGAPVGFVSPVTRFSRDPGSRTIMAIYSVACPEVDASGRRWVREVALPIAWVKAHINEVPLEPGMNREYLLRVLNWVEARGQALTLQQIREELAQADSQARQQAADNERAAAQAQGHMAPAPRGHDESAAERARRERYEAAARAAGVANLATAQAANIRLARRWGWVPIPSVYAGGPGDPQIVIDAAVFQTWMLAAFGTLLAVDGRVGEDTVEAIKYVRRAQMSGQFNGDVPRIVLSLAIAGLEDPLTAPAMPVGQRPVAQPEPAAPAASQPSAPMRGAARVQLRPGALRPDLTFKAQESGGGGLLLALLVGAAAFASKN